MSTDPPRWHKGTLMNTTNKPKVTYYAIAFLAGATVTIALLKLGGQL